MDRYVDVNDSGIWPFGLLHLGGSCLLPGIVITMGGDGVSIIDRASVEAFRASTPRHTLS